MDKKMTVVILAGGFGLRVRDYNARIPKALVPIGGMAIITHVMKIYSHYGHDRFIICAGYKSKQIKDYLENRNRQNIKSKFDIKVVDTGMNTPTGGRIKVVEKYIDSEDFFVTYCDGVSDLDINKLYRFHKKMGKMITLTAVHPMSPFGIVEVKKGVVKSFKEKPMLPGLINGGFFVFSKRIFKHLKRNSVLEEEVIKKLTEKEQLAAYIHYGFWSCMDTFKDVIRLNALWHGKYMPYSGVTLSKAPWKVWVD